MSIFLSIVPLFLSLAIAGQTDERGQLFIGAHNETLSVALKRLDCSPFGIQS